MTENNRRQAYVPDNAIIIENPVGTAPSFVVEHGDGVVISLPGVPREMKFLMNERVVPYLRDHFQLGTNVIKAKVLRTAGIGESALDDLIGTNLLEATNPTVGLAAHSGQVDVRITAKADSMETADAMIAEFEKNLRERIDQYVFGIDDEEIENALIAALKANNGRVAVCEAGIGDTVVRKLLTNPDGAAVLARGEQFADRDKLCVEVSGDPNGSLRSLAETAAQALRQSTGALVAIAIVSQGNDAQDHADSVEGSAIAVSTEHEVRSRAWGFGGSSETAESWTGTWAMSTAWRMVTENVDAG
jgi:nicotinamide-nucleotide amidase